MDMLTLSIGVLAAALGFGATQFRDRRHILIGCVAMALA